MGGTDQKREELIQGQVRWDLVIRRAALGRARIRLRALRPSFLILLDQIFCERTCLHTRISLRKMSGCGL